MPKFYDDYDWAELPPFAKQAAELLGYTQKLWDEDGKVACDELEWKELNENQQAAAQALGYSKSSWND
jgi:hypothetical protein